MSQFSANMSTLRSLVSPEIKMHKTKQEILCRCCYHNFFLSCFSHTGAHCVTHLYTYFSWASMFRITVPALWPDDPVFMCDIKRQGQKKYHVQTNTLLYYNINIKQKVRTYELVHRRGYTVVYFLFISEQTFWFFSHRTTFLNDKKKKKSSALERL